MKYWTLFTLRMIARVGLTMAIVVWLATQSCWFAAGTPFGSEHLIVVIEEPGWMIQIESMQGMPHLLWYETGEASNNTTEDAGLDRNWPIIRWSFLGVTYRQASNSDAYLIHVVHPLVCLTFLIATIATSWPRKKPTPVTEDES